MRYLSITSILGCVLIPFLFGCSKYVSLDAPTTQIEESILFTNDPAAVAATTGLYSRMTQTNLNILNGGATLYPALSADELYNTSTNSDYDLFLNNTLIVNNGSGIVRLWKSAYQNIYQVNAVLEGLAGSSKLTDSVKKQLRGEMLLTRALNFFYLANLYGEAPLTLSTDYRINQSLPRTPVSTIYQQLIVDLSEAKTLMSSSYPSTDRARPNKWVAAALLARLYLYTKQYNLAEGETTAIIQSGMYSLVQFPANSFAINATETLWQLPRTNSNTAEGATFIPSSATIKPAFAATPSLLAAFEATDKRKGTWLSKNTVSGLEYYYPSKYKQRTLTPVTEYYIVFRLAEQYLIRAEARVAQNNPTGAKLDIDVIRNRAELGGTPATTAPALLAAIDKEWQTEFFAEWGHRWMEAIRRGVANGIFGPLKGTNWQPTDILYPIPLQEIQNNLYLVQNPGY